MRQRYAEGATQRELCQAFGVSITTVGRIVRGETWHWLDEGGRAPEEPRTAPLPQAPASEIEASAERLRALLKQQEGSAGEPEGNFPPPGESKPQEDQGQ